MTSRIQRAKSGELAQTLACKALPLTFVDGRGYDCLSDRNQRKFEVRSRTAGTDGEEPRLTLTRTKMSTAEGVIFVQFDRAGMVLKALAFRVADLRPLYNRFLQKRRPTSHIPMRELSSLPYKDVTARLRSVEMAV